ncbi:hypothetical protein BASA81_014388 [Batrachochytrium salamandrivorans]|nr:hypothetical protein BASA81_014388 [Batrachochytrium salamandrivorans]
MLCCCGVGSNISLSARTQYSIGLVLACILALLLKENGTRWFPLAVTPECGMACWNNLAVYRISFGLVIYHGFLMILLIGTNSPSDPRINIQNGLLPIKLLVFAGVIVGPFFMSNSLFYQYWIACLIFSALFIILQSIILVDMARTISEACIQSYNQTQSIFSKVMLITITFTSTASFIGITVVLYKYYGKCTENNVFISVNLILNLTLMCVSIVPRVLKHNSKGGLLPSSVLAVYNTFLTAVAVVSNPSDCQTDAVWAAMTTQSSSTTPVKSAGDTAIQIAGIIFLILNIAYLAFSTSTMDLTGIESERVIDNSETTSGPKYNYSVLHLVFILTSFYMASVFTNWTQFSTSNISGVDLSTVNKGVGPMWVSVATGWINWLLYIWSLIAPLVLPDRDFS